jgi:hypothetical protein
MMLFPNARAAGWAGVATAFVTNGLRQLENLLMAPPAATTEGAYGWGGAVVERAHVLQGNGLGIATVEPGYAINGLRGLPELVGPPLHGDYGMGQNPGVQQTQILGGPSISGLGAHYGATVFGSVN